jgi:dolichol-phosphate mannosyltransferase
LIEMSVIVPAWNEAENIPQLVPRVAAALHGRAWEMLIVDDGSLDGTTNVCEALVRQYPVRLLVRNPPMHGLSGAVLDGIAATTGATIVVMDADLQHPPERIPALLDALDGGADFALGSRYVPGGSTDGQWTVFRKINSLVATVLARPFAGPVRDPMSGFFALRRHTFSQARRLTPLGYKIALELMCKCQVKRVQEVPIHFGLRTRGESKLNLKQQFRYLEHLSRLYDFTFPRASPITKFLIAMALGYAFGICIFLFANVSGLDTTASIVAGYIAGIAVTIVFHIRYVRTQRPFLITKHPWREFCIVSLIECIAVAVVAQWLKKHAVAVGPLELFTVTFACGILTRYVLRKELMHDIRGLRKELRHDEIA